MRKSWPRPECSIEQTITVTHSLPAEIGIEEPHSHDYTVRAGYDVEFNPERGCFRPMDEMASELSAVLSQLNGKHLNDVLPFLPTAEVMACWIMARLPTWWTFVEISCYGNYRVRMDANTMRSEWAARFR